MTQDNEYTDIARQLFQQQPEQEVKANILQAVETDPDQFAESFNIAKAEELPVDTVQNNLPKLKKQHEAKKFNNEYTDFLDQNPELVEFLRVPENARLSFDEIGKMNAFSRSFKTIGKAFEQGVTTNKLGRTAFAQASGIKNYGIAESQIQNLERILSDVPEKDGFLNEWIYPASKILGQVVDSGVRAIAAGTAAGSAAVIAGQAGPQIAVPEEIVTVPAAFTAGATAFFASDAYMIESGISYRELTKIEEESGQKFDPLVKNGAAVFVGVANASLEVVGMKVAAAPFRSALNKYLKGAGKNALKNKTRTAAVKTFAKEYAKVVGAETATEIVQEGVNILAEQVAQHIDFKNFEGALNDPKQRDEIFDRLFATGSEVFRGMALLGLAGSGANLTSDYAAARKARRDQDLVRAIGEDAKDSKLLKRVPEKYREFIAATKGNVQNVYIDSTEFKQFFQSKQVDPIQVAEELGISPQLEETSLTGGDLSIPLESYAEKMAATEFHNGLASKIKFRPEDMTESEASKVDNDVVTLLRKQANEAENTIFEDIRRQAPSEKVYDEVVEQLTSAGRSADIAQKEALIWRAFFDTMGQRSGIDSYSLYKKQNIRITRDLPAFLHKKTISEIDAIIEKVRSAKGVSDQRVFGNSLNEFIESQGGILGTDVNTDSLDNSIELSENGKTLDDLAIAAVEAGFFDGKPTIEQFTDAINGETQGQRVFSKLQNPDLEGDLQQVEEAEKFFDTLEINIEEQGNADIKQRVLDFEKQIEGKDLFQDSTDNKDLVAQHNLSLENIKNVKRTGGLPVPSLAITKKDNNIKSFGEITLLADKELIDPRASRSNKVFAADIYSSRYPSINFVVSPDGVNNEMRPVIQDLRSQGVPEADLYKYIDVNNIEDRGRKYLSESGAVALKFLKENGKKIPSTEQDSNGDTSHYKTSVAYVDAANKDKEFQAFIDDLADAVIEKEQILDGITEDGTRKYLSHNVENVVRVMKRKLNDGEVFNYGVGSIRAIFTKKFRSIADIKGSKSKLITEEQMLALKAEIDSEFIDLAESMKSKSIEESSPFVYVNAFSEHLKEAAEIGVPRMLDEYYQGHSQEDINRIGGFLIKLEGLPAEYFEAKLQRAVDLGEFSGAVVPKGEEYNEAINILNDAGVKDIRRYEKGNEQSRTNAIGNFEKLFFQNKDEKRGSFSLNAQGEKVIKLFEKADLSTFLHESGHFFLESLGEMAKADIATQDIKDDYNKILDFLEVKEQSQIGTEQHEKFARAFEAYAFEGKAPSVELAAAFRRFKQWLTNIYRRIQDLDVTLSDDIRGVFDRMLATEQQIQDLEQASNYTPLLTKKNSGMSDDQYQSYIDLSQKATVDAENNLLKKTMEEVKRERLETYKDEKNKIRSQAEKDVMESNGNQAMHYLQEGDIFDRDIPESLRNQKLDTNILVDLYGKEILDQLPKGKKVYGKDGVHPDKIAEMFGMDSGDALVKALIKSIPIKSQIEQNTEAQMKQKHGDMLNDGSIEQEAQKSIRNESRSRLIAIELDAIAQMTGIDSARKEFRPNTKGIATSQRVAKEAAKRFVSGTLVKDLQVGKHISSEVRAAKQAQIELNKGNIQEALEQKQKQIFNHYLYIESRNAIERTDKIVKYMSKFSKRSTRERLGKAGGGYLDQIDKLLERTDFRRSVSAKQAEKRVALSAWIESQKAEGKEVVIDPRLEDESLRKSYKLMETEQLFGLEDTIKNIDHLARTKNKLLARRDAKEFHKIVDDIVSTIEANNTLSEDKPDYAPTIGKKLAKIKDNFLAKHTKMEFLFEQLDGHSNLGAVWDSLFKPLADAEIAEQVLMESVTKKLNKAFNSRYSRVERASWMLDRKHFDGLGQSFNKASVISLALNWGNEGNRKAIREGQGWSDAQVREVLDSLDKKDWDLVQDVLDIINELWEPSKQLHLDITGVAPEKVESAVIDTKYGRYRGGYYPLKYDPEFSLRQFIRDEKQLTKDLFSSGWTTIQTKKGHLKERVGSAGQNVKLDLSVMTEHIGNVIRDVSHRKALLDVDKLTRNPRVAEAIQKAAGKELYKQIKPWLKNISGDKREPAGGFERIIGRARTGATVVNMGWKVTTAIVQPLGYLQSIDLLGGKYAWKGLIKFYSNPIKMKETVGFIMDRSTMMRNRQKTFDRDVRDTLKKTTLKGTAQEIQQSFFYFTGLMDMGVSAPTWIGAYQKAMDGKVDGVESGNENKAIDFADKTVRMSQSAGGAKDLSNIQVGSEYHRIFTMFYSYFNVLYGLFRRRVQLTKGIKDIPRFAASMMYLWIAPAILSEMVAGRAPEEDEDKAKWTAEVLGMYPLSTLVGVRDIANATITKYGFSASPAFDALDHTSRALKIPFKALNDDVDLGRGDAKSALLAVSYWGQLPGRQMWITGEYLTDYMTGEEDEFSFRDLFFTRTK